MVAQFLTGVIVGLLIGLALAPVMRSWIAWQMAKPWRDAEARRPSPLTTPLDRERFRAL